MKINAIEFIATTSCVAIIPLVLTIPTFNAEIYGTGCMAHTIYIIFTNAIALLILFNLFFKFPGMDFIDISEYLGGKAVKYISTVLSIGYILTTAIIVLSEFNENIRNILFENAPKEYIYFIFLIGILVGVFSGLKGIFRTATIITPIILLSLLFMFFSLYKEIDLTNYTPILGNDSTRFFKDVFRIEYFEGMFLILLLGDILKNPKKVAVCSYLITSIIVLIITFLLFGIIPYPSVVENYFPFYELSRLMSFGRFWQRVESFYTLIWLIAVYIYISIGPAYTAHVLSKVFDLECPKRIVPAICIIMITATSYLTSYVDVLKVKKVLYLYITPYLLLGYSFIILSLAYIKKRRKLYD